MNKFTGAFFITLLGVAMVMVGYHVTKAAYEKSQNTPSCEVVHARIVELRVCLANRPGCGLTQEEYAEYYELKRIVLKRCAASDGDGPQSQQATR